MQKWEIQVQAKFAIAGNFIVTTINHSTSNLWFQFQVIPYNILAMPSPGADPGGWIGWLATPLGFAVSIIFV